MTTTWTGHKKINHFGTNLAINIIKPSDMAHMGFTKKKEVKMEWFEIIHIRLFSQKDTEAAMRAFSRLDVPDVKGT